MGNSDSIQYQVVVLVFSNGLAILGELGKLVPVSEGRIAAVHLINNATTLVLELLGTPQEVVEITFASSGSSKSSSKSSSANCANRIRCRPWLSPRLLSARAPASCRRRAGPAARARC